MSIFLLVVIFLREKIPFFAYIDRIVKGVRIISRDRRKMLLILLLLSINCLLGAVEILFSYRAFSVDVSLMQALLIASATIFSGVIRIIPGNLGIYEGTVALSSQLMGIGFEKGLLAAALASTVSMVVIFVCGSLSGAMLRKYRY